MTRSKALVILLPVLLLVSCVDSGRERGRLDMGKFSRLLGVNLYNFDRQVRPQDDFYRYVNGRWLATSQIPDEQATLGTFTDMIGRVDATLYAVMQDLLGRPDEGLTPDQRLLRDSYLAWLDAGRIEALGVTPLAPVLDRIATARGPEDLSRLFGRHIRSGLGGPVDVLVGADPKDTTTNRVQLRQAGLGLPDRQYYLAGVSPRRPAGSPKVLGAYRKYIADMFLLAGWAKSPQDADGRAGAVLMLETRLASAQRSRVANRDRLDRYNRYGIAALSALAPGLDWAAFFEGLGAPSPEFVIARQPEYLVALSVAMTGVPLETWQDYLAFHAISETADLLPARFGERKFAFYRGTLQGISVRRAMHRRAIAYVSRDLGDLFGRLYVERAFSSPARDEVRAMAVTIRHAFGRRIEQLDWMSPETKQAAQAKLSRLEIKIGYPDNWPATPGLTVSADDLFGNALRISEWDTEQELSRIDGPVDRSKWSVSPQTVNAYYRATANEVVVPAGMLQPPFFNLTADRAVNFGGIGAIIGHEISHAFDDQGRKSDGDGNLADWWNAEDSKEFERRTAKFARQYEAYSPLKDVALDGRLTLGENMGDLGGLEVAYDAYLAVTRPRERKRSVFGFSGQQRLFLGWAQIWRRTYREQELRRRLITDNHSPAEFRVNGIVANVAGFYEAFGVVEGDALYLAPEDRVSIW